MSRCDGDRQPDDDPVERIRHLTDDGADAVVQAAPAPRCRAFPFDATNEATCAMEYGEVLEPRPHHARQRGHRREIPVPRTSARYRHGMRHCARPGCNAPAVATLTFDGLRRILWISPLAEAPAYSAGDLCRRHAERMQPPRNWEVRDTRPRPSDTSSAASAAPSRYVAPPPPPPEPLPFERTAARRTGAPVLARGSGAGGEAFRDAHTPLLARAFRTAR